MDFWRRNLLPSVVIAVVAAAVVPPTTLLAQINAQPLLPIPVLGEPESNGEVAQNVFLPAERIVLQRLAKARELLDQARYGEAVRYLGAILDGPEDYFFQPDKDLPVHRSLKAEAQRLIGQMPRKGRELYELQYGAKARQMLAEAVTQGDPVGVAEVSRRLFHTQSGYEATLLLGLDHLDHGRPLAGALTLHRLRRSAANADQFEPTLSLAAATCWLQAGMPEKARNSLVTLKKQQGNGTVTVGGQRVSWFGKETEASQWLAALIGPQQLAAPLEADRWTMFRGSTARNATSAGGAVLLNMRWRIPSTDDPLMEDQLRRLQQADQERGIPSLPGLHPLVVDDVVLMRTSRNLLAVDFVTGKRLWELPVDEPEEGPKAEIRVDPFAQQFPQLASGLGYRMWDDAIYGTMSSDGRYVFSIEDLSVSISRPATQRVIINGRSQTVARKPHNRLAAHDIRTGKLKWHLGGPADEYALRQAEAFFLGPPLPLMGQLYVLAEVKEEIRLLALDARSGDLLWAQQLAVVEHNVAMDPMRRLAGASPSYRDGILVCPTSAGAVVAVELATRSLLWGYRYVRPQASNRYSGLFLGMDYSAQEPAARWLDASAAVAKGRVLVSPIESRSLHCLNLIDGELLWKYKNDDDLYVGCVHADKVILVGRREIRAVSLLETVEKEETVRLTERNGNTSRTVNRKVTVQAPKPAWDGRSVTLSEGSMPSGRGFFSGNLYFLPLTSAEVVAVDLNEGKIVQTSKSRKGHVPGNLICYKGKVISQGFDGLETYYQLDSVRRQVDERLAAEPDDAESLSLRGEILLDEGKLSEAIACLRRAYQLGPTPRIRNLFRDALLDGLRTQFAEHRERAEEIENLLDTPEQRVAYLRLLATGLRQTGQWQAALDHYLMLVDVDQQAEGLEAVSESLSVRRDRWVQAQLAVLRDEMDDDSLIDRAIEARLKAALAAPNVDTLRRFLAYFGNHPTAGKARRELFRQLKKAGLSLEAEMVLWDQQQSPDPAVAGVALAELAEVFRQNKRPKAAAWCYGRLKREFAEVVCLNGKTGRELFDALPADGTVLQAIGGEAPWPLGKVEVESKSSARKPSSSSGRYVLSYRGSPAPFFSELTIRLDQSRRSILGHDAFGNQQWKTVLSESRERQYFPYGAKQAYGRVRGHLLVLSVGAQIIGIDTLGSSETSQPKVLWKHNLSNASFDALNLRRLALQIPNMWRMGGFGGFHPGGYYYNQNVDALGPVTAAQVCFQRYRNLIAADPLTGKTLWIRRGVASSSVLFGDDRFVFAVAPDEDEALVLRASDGELLGRRKVPRTKHTQIMPDRRRHTGYAPFNQSCIATLGRRILVWRNEDGQKVLELLDLWEGTPAWPARKFSSDARYSLAAEEAIGVFEPDGDFVLLSLGDGRTIAEATLKPEGSSLSDITVFSLGDQYFLITNSQRSSLFASPRLHTQPISGAPYKPINRGRVYAFGGDGKLTWPKPAKIENQHLVLNQPARLPVLIFACQIYDRKQVGTSQQQTSLVCIDRRNGRKVYSKKFTRTTNTLEISGDPAKDSARVRLSQYDIAMTFTNGPLPPLSQTPDEEQGNLLAPVRSLWKSIGKAMRVAADEPKESEAAPATPAPAAPQQPPPMIPPKAEPTPQQPRPPK